LTNTTDSSIKLGYGILYNSTIDLFDSFTLQPKLLLPQSSASTSEVFLLFFKCTLKLDWKSLALLNLGHLKSLDQGNDRQIRFAKNQNPILVFFYATDK